MRSMEYKALENDVLQYEIEKIHINKKTTSKLDVVSVVIIF